MIRWNITAGNAQKKSFKTSDVTKCWRVFKTFHLFGVTWSSQLQEMFFWNISNTRFLNHETSGQYILVCYLAEKTSSPGSLYFWRSPWICSHIPQLQESLQENKLSLVIKDSSMKRNNNKSWDFSPIQNEWTWVSFLHKHLQIRIRSLKYFKINPPK